MHPSVSSVVALVQRIRTDFYTCLTQEIVSRRATVSPRLLLRRVHAPSNLHATNVVDERLEQLRRQVRAGILEPPLDIGANSDVYRIAPSDSVGPADLTERILAWRGRLARSIAMPTRGDGAARGLYTLRASNWPSRAPIRCRWSGKKSGRRFTKSDHELDDVRVAESPIV